MTRSDVRRSVHEIASTQDGVLSREQARSVGADRQVVSTEVAAGRWQAIGQQSLAAHGLGLDLRARARVATWEAGVNAALDGATSLLFAGLRGFDNGVHVIVPWPHGGRSWSGSRIHNSRLWSAEDLVTTAGVRRTNNAVAAVRAAMYARTDRAAATVMAMAVQQRLASAAAVLAEALRVNRHRRRPFIVQIARDIADGAQALGELDFTRLCRLRGLPPPTRQVLREGPHGRIYLDVYWDEFRVVVEVEGMHHDAPENIVDDSLRQNALTAGREAVIRIPVLGLRTCPDLFLDQLEACLRAHGWRRAA